MDKACAESYLVVDSWQASLHNFQTRKQIVSVFPVMQDGIATGSLLRPWVLKCIANFGVYKCDT